MNINQRGPHTKLPTFNGENDSSYESWAHDLEDAFEHLGWGPEHQSRVTVIPTLLTGLAKIRYRNMPSGIQRDYHALMKELNRQFGRPSKSAVHIFQQLDRPQLETESVRTFSREILQRLQNAGVTDEGFMLATYLKNLRPAIKAKVLLMRPETLRDAEQFAETVEQSLPIEQAGVQQTLSAITAQLDMQSQATTAALNAINNKSVNFNVRSRTPWNSRERDYRPRSRDRSYE